MKKIRFTEEETVTSKDGTVYSRKRTIEGTASKGDEFPQELISSLKPKKPIKIPLQIEITTQVEK